MAHKRGNLADTCLTLLCLSPPRPKGPRGLQVMLQALVCTAQVTSFSFPELARWGLMTTQSGMAFTLPP